MNTKRCVVVVAVLAATLSLSATSCSTISSQTGTSTDQRDARPDLDAAARWLTEQKSITNVERAGISESSLVNPQARTGTATVKYPGTDRSIWATRLGDEFFISILGVPGISFGTRYLVPRSQVPAGSSLDFMHVDDLSGAGRLVDAVVSARRVGDRSFAGAIDLMATRFAKGDPRQKFGDKVHAVPFSATVDDQGRLVGFVIALDSLAPGHEPVRMTWRAFDKESNPDKRPQSPQPLEDVAGLLRTLEGGSVLGTAIGG